MLKPALMGGVMAGLMIWMMHDRLMSGGVDLSLGLIGFVLAHLAIVAGLAALALFIPRLRRALSAHRPGLKHALGMVSGMAVTALVIHLAMHGGFA